MTDKIKKTIEIDASTKGVAEASKEIAKIQNAMAKASVIAKQTTKALKEEIKAQEELVDSLKKNFSPSARTKEAEAKLEESRQKLIALTGLRNGKTSSKKRAKIKRAIDKARDKYVDKFRIIKSLRKEDLAPIVEAENKLESLTKGEKKYSKRAESSKTSQQLALADAKYKEKVTKAEKKQKDQEQKLNEKQNKSKKQATKELGILTSAISKVTGGFTVLGTALVLAKNGIELLKSNQLQENISGTDVEHLQSVADQLIKMGAIGSKKELQTKIGVMMKTLSGIEGGQLGRPEPLNWVHFDTPAGMSKNPEVAIQALMQMMAREDNPYNVSKALEALNADFLLGMPIDEMSASEFASGYKRRPTDKALKEAGRKTQKDLGQLQSRFYSGFTGMNFGDYLYYQSEHQPLMQSPPNYNINQTNYIQTDNPKMVQEITGGNLYPEGGISGY